MVLPPSRGDQRLDRPIRVSRDGNRENLWNKPDSIGGSRWQETHLNRSGEWMNAFQNFMSKAADLYLAAPIFFNWAAGVVFAIACGVIWFAYWLGGKLLEGQVAELKGKVEVLEQRVAFGRQG